MRRSVAASDVRKGEVKAGTHQHCQRDATTAMTSSEARKRLRSSSPTPTSRFEVGVHRKTDLPEDTKPSKKVKREDSPGILDDVLAKDELSEAASDFQVGAYSRSLVSDSHCDAQETDGCPEDRQDADEASPDAIPSKRAL